jgi:hypothetical protein
MYKFSVPVIVQIIPKREPARLTSTVRVNIFPAATTEQTVKINYPFNITPKPVEIILSEPIIATAYQYLQNIFNTYVDEDRTLKTLLNYGEDRQSVILAKRYGNMDINGLGRIQLKLLQPVPDDISTTSTVFLSREVAKTLIDTVRIRFAPQLDKTPYLRPKNTKVDTGLSTGKYLPNVTLQRLQLSSGSTGLVDEFKNKTFEDEIFRKWYSYDFNSTELNLDFSDYDNFVFYGSATMRLEAFKEKISRINRIEQNRIQFLSSSTYTVTTSSAGAVFVQEKSAQYAKEKEEVIRGFDRYEQYLYFTPSGSDSPYSASAYYADTGTEYNSIGYWPKNESGSLYLITNPITEEWFTTQLEIAQRFDEFNENNLVNTVPTHVREDDNNAAYITFVSMIGHFFDNIRPYIDQFTQIYSRNLNPNEQLSKDLINEIAESIGFRLPTLNSIYNLTDNILGTVDVEPRRDLTAEIYKRLLHNVPFYAKAKGTKTALDAFIRTFGITPQLISVRETGTPTKNSYYTFDEYSTGLDFDETKNSYVRLPISTSLRNPTTLQFNMSAAKNKTMTVLTGDDKWALNVVVHPSSSDLGRFEITSGSSNTRILSSSYYEIYNDELINVAIQNYTTGTSSLYVTQTEGEDIIFTDAATETTYFNDMWKDTQYVYVGGAGPRVVSGYEGTVDDLRLWKTILSEETLLNSAFDPGSNAGDTYDAASDELLVVLNFNKINTGSVEASSSITNQSPYKNISVSPSLEELFIFNVSGSDFNRYTKAIRQEMAIVGSTGKVSNKIKIAAEPTFIKQSTGDKRLYRTQSIVSPETKRLQRGRNKVIVGVSPTEIINQNIIRNFGYENINAILGSPTTLYTTFEKSLATLKKHYQQYYYVDVNTNRFVRIMSELSSVLDQVVDYFIPSKATLLKGILIEPNILEQVKIPPVKNIRFYGKDTRKTLNAPGSLTSSNSDYGATFNVTKTIDVKPTIPIAEYPTYKQINRTYLSSSFIAKTSTYNTKLESVPTLSGSEHKLLATIIPEVIVGAQIDQYEVVSQYKAYLTQSIYPTPTGNYSYYTSSLNLQEQTPPPLNAVVESINSELLNQISTNATYMTYTASMSMRNEILTASYNLYNIQHETTNYTGSRKTQRINVGLDNLNKIPYNDTSYGSHGAEPYNRLYSRKLFGTEINAPRIGGETSIYTPALYDIPPSADFREFGVYTYFNNENGIYYFPEVIKSPAYSRPLTQQWNFTEQAFDSITTWSYGSSYNIYDVVYQNVTRDDLTTLGSISFKDVNAGNNRYYVFKNRPAYRPTEDGTAFYSGSVPAYLPPSLDRNNWELLRFTPVQKRVPKRVVFDTFTVTTPELNNFKTTTISINRIIDLVDRYVDPVVIPPISPNSYVTGEISLQNMAALFAVQANTSDVRIRLYRTIGARDADINRSIEVRPEDSHGVLLDMSVINSNILQITNPIPTLVAGGSPPAGKIYYTINNNTSLSKLGITLHLFYFALQIEPRVPRGYLRKHYRFFRDNSTGTKRRNYLGCKNTQDTTIDGLPAIQVFLSEGTDIVISPTTTNQEIITGGGGQLNVT